MSSASAAPMRRPVKISSLALPRPTSRGSRWVPPAPGMMASRVSVSPMVAVSAAIRISQASASSVPPPRAIPLTAAMTGLLSCSMAVNRLRIVKINSLTFMGLKVARSLRSAPAQNAFSPAPVMITTRISVLNRRASICCSRAFNWSKLNEFITRGRFRVSRST